MPQTCPIDIVREVERRWERRSTAVPVPRRDNDTGAGRCPACNGPAALAPAAAEYRGGGIIHHQWRCSVCGCEWVTVLHVPT